MNDGAIAAEILEHTAAENYDNVSRTLAYQNFHLRNPEIGWPLLASLVSRNAGYLMTDLRRDPVAAMLSPRAIENFFAALESCNSAIFLDAYPQLLLYERSKLAGVPLFHLLDRLCGSRSLAPYWLEHWRGGPSARLDLALVVNEQCHLERRVFANPLLGGCFSTAPFVVAMRLGAFSLVFPGLARGGRGPSPLYALRVRRFAQLEGRIAMGRRLYGLLFDSAAGESVIGWVRQRPDHTGSRADYAPEIFAAEAQHRAAWPVPSLPLRQCWPPVRLLEHDGAPWNWPAGAERFVAPIGREHWPDRRVRHGTFFRRMAALGRGARWFVRRPQGRNAAADGGDHELLERPIAH